MFLLLHRGSFLNPQRPAVDRVIPYRHSDRSTAVTDSLSMAVSFPEACSGEIMSSVSLFTAFQKVTRRNFEPYVLVKLHG